MNRKDLKTEPTPTMLGFSHRRVPSKRATRRRFEGFNFALTDVQPSSTVFISLHSEGLCGNVCVCVCMCMYVIHSDYIEASSTCR